VFPLEFADILDNAGALVQQVEQPLVNFVNLSAPLPNPRCHRPSPLKFFPDRLSKTNVQKQKSRDLVSRGFRSFAGWILGFHHPSTRASVGRHSKVVAVSVSEAKSISVHERNGPTGQQ
jgi:hypothetical protein